MVVLNDIKHGWSHEVSLSKRGFIIWRRLVRWLSQQRFDLYSLSLSFMVGRFISWISIMRSWMTFFRRRCTWHNHLVLLTLHSRLMCVVFINLCMVWNKSLGHGTTGKMSFWSSLAFTHRRLILLSLFSPSMVLYFIYLCMLMIFYWLGVTQLCFNDWLLC
jgi:hypothetical protein